MGCSTPLTEACVFRRQVTEVLDDLEQDVFTDFGKEILEEAAQSHKLLTMVCILVCVTTADIADDKCSSDS